MGRRSNAARRREEIVWALYHCLAAKGHETVTVREIAARAGLPPGLIHYYFASKDEIVSDLARALVERYAGRLEKRLAGARSGEERTEIALDFAVDDLVFNRPLNRVFYNLVQMAFERESLGEALRAMLRTYRTRMAEVFGGNGAGRGAALSAGTALVAVTEGLALQWMIEPRAFGREEARGLLAEALGLRGGGGGARRRGGGGRRANKVGEAIPEGGGER